MRENKVFEPAELLVECILRPCLALQSKPLARHRFKRVGSDQPGADFQFVGAHPQNGIFQLARQSQRHVGVDAEREEFFASLIPVLEAPPATALGRDHDVQATLVKELIGLASGLGRSQGSVGQRHGGICFERVSLTPLSPLPKVPGATAWRETTTRRPWSANCVWSLCRALAALSAVLTSAIGVAALLRHQLPR